MSNIAELEGVLDARAAEVASLLIKQDVTVATAESCTGGLLASALTSVAGSSAYFPGGVISYDNKVKTDMLGVPVEVLAEHGAVSAPVALAMAYGVRKLLKTNIGLSVTGIAGPSGATPNKPVGTTFIACVSEDWEDVRHFHFSGDRAGNRALSVENALIMLATLLESRQVGVPVGAMESEASRW